MRRKDLLKARREWKELSNITATVVQMGTWAARWGKYLIDDAFNLRKLAKQKAKKRSHTFARLATEEKDRDEILDAVEKIMRGCPHETTRMALIGLLERYNEDD